MVQDRHEQVVVAGEEVLYALTSTQAP